jgi:hypothetical protein
MLKQSIIISFISIMSMQCAANKGQLQWYIQTPDGTIDRWDYMGEVSDAAKETSWHQARVDQRYTQTLYQMKSGLTQSNSGKPTYDKDDNELYTYHNVTLVPAYIVHQNVENNATIVNAAQAAVQEQNFSKKDIRDKLAESIKTYKKTGQPRQVDSYEDIIENLDDDQKNVIMEAGEKSIELAEEWVSKFN